jgi:hypothetical protein
MITIAIKATIMAYSTAVAPSSSLKNLINLSIFYTPFLKYFSYTLIKNIHLHIYNTLLYSFSFNTPFMIIRNRFGSGPSLTKANYAKLMPPIEVIRKT